MPISPESVSRLVPDGIARKLQTGSRLGTGKDIVLAVDKPGCGGSPIVSCYRFRS